jgi:hypothetical protein
MVLEQKIEDEKFSGAVGKESTSNNEMMMFYQTNKFESVPISTIEVDDEEEAPAQQMNNKHGVDLPVFYNNQQTEVKPLNLDQILQKERDSHFLDRVDK